MFGYQGRWAFVDLGERSVRIEPADERACREYVGGRGVQAALIHDHLRRTGPIRNPLSPQNRIVIGGAACNDTPVPTAGRGSCSFVSPMTRSAGPAAWVPNHRPVFGLPTHSSAGGRFPNTLKRAGIDQLIVDGRADRPVRLIVAGGSVRIIEAEAELFETAAGRVVLRPTSEVAGAARRVSPASSTVCTGPAGWNQVPFACLTNDRHRNFGRGGAGAVFGSKNLVAITASGDAPTEAADSARFSRVARAIDRLVREQVTDPARTASFRPRTGTTWWLDRAFDGRFFGREGGYLPFHNFDEGTFDPSGFERVSTEAFEAIAGRHEVCSRCRHLTCTRSASVAGGPYAGRGVRPEFESIALWINCGVTDREAIFHANRLCNELGIDTMSFGSVLAAAMELSGRNLMREFPDAPIFGSASDMITTLEAIAFQSSRVGALLGQDGDAIIGALAAGGDRAHAAEIARAVTFAYGGLGYAGVEPKAFPGMFTAYSTSNRGRGDHTHAWTVQAEENGLSGPAQLGQYVASAQAAKALVDSLGLCEFFTADVLSDQFLDLYGALTGVSYSPESFEACGRRIYSVERRASGIQGRARAYDAFIPEKFTEPLRAGPMRGRAVDPAFHALALDALYAHHGWARGGLVEPDTLERLGVEP